MAPTSAPPTLLYYSRRRRKPSAEIEHPSAPRKVASSLSGKKLPAKAKTAAPVKKKTAKSKAPRKKARAGAKEGDAEKPVDDDVRTDNPDEEQLAAVEQGGVRLPAKRRVGRPVPREEAVKAWPMISRDLSDDEELEKVVDLLVAQY